MEKQKTSGLDRLETVFKIFTPVGAIVAFLVGIYHYRDTRSEDFRKAYWDKRYNVYEELSTISSRIANATDSVDMDSLKRHFWILYSGKSIMVEDLHVMNSLKSFASSLAPTAYPDSLHVLRKKSHIIAHACRISLKETWDPVSVQEIKTLDE